MPNVIEEKVLVPLRLTLFRVLDLDMETAAVKMTKVKLQHFLVSTCVSNQGFD
jgi:hypothetical protein